MTAPLDGTNTLVLRLASTLEGLAHSLEAVAGPGGLVTHARELATEARHHPAAVMPQAAPAAPPPPSDLEATLREYLTTPHFPVRMAAKLDLEEMLGLPVDRPARERARREVLAQVEQVNAMAARAKARRRA